MILMNRKIPQENLAAPLGFSFPPVCLDRRVFLFLRRLKSSNCKAAEGRYIKSPENKTEYKDDWDAMIGSYAKNHEVDSVEPILAFDPNCEDADPEWKENLTSYVDMVCDVFYFLLS